MSCNARLRSLWTQHDDDDEEEAEEEEEVYNVLNQVRLELNIPAQLLSDTGTGSVGDCFQPHGFYYPLFYCV